MGWEELLESLDGLETKDAYDGYFCSVKDAVVIIILGSLCGLQNFKQIHEWATTEHVHTFLEKEFGIKRIPCYWWLLSLIALVTPLAEAPAEQEDTQPLAAVPHQPESTGAAVSSGKSRGIRIAISAVAIALAAVAVLVLVLGLKKRRTSHT